MNNIDLTYLDDGAEYEPCHRCGVTAWIFLDDEEDQPLCSGCGRQ